MARTRDPRSAAPARRATPSRGSRAAGRRAASARAAATPRPDGSRRVREVQRRLLRRGYRPGPVDGRFGARTRAAVLWFQTKHGLPRTGRVDARSVATLRQHRRARPSAHDRGRSEPAQRRRAGGARGRPTSPPASLEPADRAGSCCWRLMIVLGLAMIVWWLRAELRATPSAARTPSATRAAARS